MRSEHARARLSSTVWTAPDYRYTNACTNTRRAFVPQFDKVLRPLSFRDNLRAEGQLMPRRERDKRLAELFDLTPRVRASTGSSSQLAIGLGATAVGRLPRHDAAATDADAGRTLIRTSPVRASELFDTIAGIRQRDGAAVMLVEQNATQSLSISERVVVQGRVAMTHQAGGPTGIEGWA